jgi:ABC-type glutathione transport system ATPase component
MLVRLAFAVMIQVDADILLIDEVLAVGDAAFQQKCFDEFVRIREAGKTILLVTHDMGAVHRFCDRAMLLERGVKIADGDPDDVGTRYLELNFSEAARADAAKAQLGSTERIGDGTAEITDAWFEDEAGERTGTVASGGRTTFVARVKFVQDVEDPLFGVVLQNDRKETVLAASNLWSNPKSGRFAAGTETEYRITFDNLLTPTRYLATPAVARQGGGIAWIDRRERMLTLLVSGLARTDAVVDLPYDVAIAPVTREEVPS